jgi:predicted DNA-binding protein (MmcQ/YjbR family)
MQHTTAYTDRVRALALSFPQTYEDAPWGFPVFKVGANKLFAWMTERDGRVDVTVKLTAE